MPNRPLAGLVMVNADICAARLGCRLSGRRACGWGGARARGPPSLCASAECCAVWTYAQQSSRGPLLGAARFGCGLSGRCACGWRGPALAGRRALAPKPYAALYGPLVSRPRAGLVKVRPGLGAGCRVSAAAAGGARRSRVPGPLRPGRMLCCLDLFLLVLY